MQISIAMKGGKFRDSIAKTLSSEGWVIDLFDSARDALSSIGEHASPDIIISDLLLGDIDGWKFCYLLKSAEMLKCNSIPILVVSHLYTRENGETMARALGADSYISLPDDEYLLVKEIKKLKDKNTIQNDHNSVLIVEDDPTLLHLISKSFEKSNWQVTPVTSSHTALRLLPGSCFDLAVIDYHLPETKGDRILKEIMGGTSDTTCIMITADATPQQALEWLEIGAAAYLHKPFSPHYLIEVALRCMKEKVWRNVERQLEEKTDLLNDRQLLIDDFEKSLVDVFWVRNLDFSYRYVSPSIVNLTGHNFEATCLLSLEEEMSPESADRFIEVVNEEIAKVLMGVESVPRKVLLEVTHQKGHKIWVETRLKIKASKFGEPLVISGMTKDISLEKENEERLSSLYSAISQADDVIVVTDLDGKIEFANTAFERVTGYGTSEIVGSNMNILKSGAHDHEFYRSLWSTLLSGKKWSGQMTNKRKDGTLYQERVRISPIRNSHDQIVRFVAVKHDLTQELELLNEKEELEARYMQSQKLEAIGSLAAGMIHDFNNILTPIVGYAHLIKLKYPDDALIQEDIDQILVAGDRAKELVKQILTFSRSKAHKPQLVKLDHLIRECMTLAQAFLPARINVSCNLEKEYPWVKIDPTRFSQLLMNLITNSYHAMEEKGNLTITLQEVEKGKHSRYIRLNVIDTGFGIPQENYEKIFEPFYTTKEEGLGSGLGLSVVKNIVDDAGGDIFIENSSLENGTSIAIDLPVYTNGKIGQTAKPPIEAKFDGQERNVLLVDDDRIVLDYLSSALMRLNFRVEPYSDSKEALRIFKKKRKDYQLLFTDIEMPNHDGLELIKNVRHVRSDIPIIVCTGNSQYEETEMICEAEKVKILNKPVTVSDVSAAMKNLFCNENTVKCD